MCLSAGSLRTSAVEPLPRRSEVLEPAEVEPSAEHSHTTVVPDRVSLWKRLGRAGVKPLLEVSMIVAFRLPGLLALASVALAGGAAPGDPQELAPLAVADRPVVFEGFVFAPDGSPAQGAVVVDERGREGRGRRERPLPARDARVGGVVSGKHESLVGSRRTAASDCTKASRTHAPARLDGLPLPRSWRRAPDHSRRILQTHALARADLPRWHCRPLQETGAPGRKAMEAGR